MQTKELTTIQEMLSQFKVMQFLYPKLTIEKYESYLQEMITRNYTQIAVFDNEKCIGITGCWFGIKLWSGKYLEIDNFIVHPDYRSKGIGKMLTDYVNQKALDLSCTNIVLDAYTHNFKAHRFFYNQGFGPKGFHFVKILDEEGLN
ncbi:GNAT family N-acetyltransferase [Flavobacterium sp.]|uniref:GNAT family N-acetyltransferase n=1 Tax=Flavobacterium sp. TaxID=239 RepID=UPI0037533A52